MPAFIGGAVKVIVVGIGATVEFGDTGVISPSTSSGSSSGSGGFSTGDFGRSVNALNTVETLDVDVLDTNINTTV